MKDTLIPVGDRVLVMKAEARQEKGSLIVIPEAVKEPSQEAVVVTLGTGRIGKDGQRVPFEVKPGDRVLVTKYGGTVVTVDGSDCKIVEAGEILAVIN